jgi:two-component system response regulator YesN
MINLLIVDDEKLVREAIAREFGYHGFDVFQAADGDEALNTIRNNHIDAMILDLKMPKVGGLDLLNLLSSEGIENIVTVILTGYSDLAFAQEAIHFGVKDYLLKPLVPDELAQLSIELKDNIEIQNRNIEAHEQLLKQVEESKPILKERLFWDLVTQQVDSGSINEKLDLLGITLQKEWFQVILIELDTSDSANIARSSRRMNMITLAKALENRILGLLALEKNITVFHLSTKIFAILYNCDKAEAENGQIDPLLQKLTNTVANHLGVTITMSLGTIVRGIENIKKSYYCAVGTINYRDFYGRGTILKTSDFLSDEEIQELAFTLEDVAFLVKTEQTQKLLAHIQNTFDLISNKSLRFDLGTTYLICNKYICAILSALVEYGIRIDDLYRDRPNPLQDGGNRRNIDEMRIWIQQTAKEVIQNVADFRKRRNTTIVEKAKAFIGSNYAQDVSNLVMSQTIGVSPNYLGQVFKRETGDSVHDYLNNVRIEEAKKLLKTTNLLVFEIAFRVGYKDQYYFSTVFRKKVGLTPKEYREI